MSTSEIMSQETFTKEMAVASGNAVLKTMTQDMGAASNAPMCVIQHGKEAYRPGEPAHIEKEFINVHPETDVGGFFAKIRYEDGVASFIDMHLPKYPSGRKPPLIGSRKVYIEATAPNGVKVRKVSTIERSSDKRHYLEFVLQKDCRRALRVIGRE